jgi:hypothetical protein
MLKTLAALTALTHQMFSAEHSLAVKTLSQKALDDRILKAMLWQMESEAESNTVCAIPLREPPARAGHLDPMARAANSASFDKIAHPVEVRACRWR